MRTRILIDEIIKNIKTIDSEIDSYNENMDEKSFIESNEVEELYNKIKNLGLDLWYIDK